MFSERLTVGWHLLERGENEAARAEFSKAIAANSRDSEALVGLGKALARLGQPSEALDAFKKALLFDPNKPEAHYGASWAHWKRKEWREAESHTERALALEPSVAKYHVMMAECARKRSDLEIALNHLETAINLDPGALGKRSQHTLTYFRIFAGVEKVVPVLGLAFLVTLYSCTLLATGQWWWFLVISLPFLMTSGWNLVKHRYRPAVWSLILGLLWTVPVYFLGEGLISR